MVRSVRKASLALARELPGVAPAVVVVGMLACILVPVPTPLVDLLLSTSLAGALLLLIAGLRVRRVTDFLSFPTLVLVLTLYRITLNLSTTRLILQDADAGRVIDAFAGLVIGGDLIVGAVMFAVITAIQYVVVARGAERIAEVAARFALDGMPGQQAAIDADLRSGAIGPREAQARRASLAERSDLFGRMDGVMRWVKGDAIIGVVITAVNLLGGLAIGSGRGDLSVAGSLMLYGRLAIGDGLLAQIPALLVSLAAAVLVARVDRVREHDEGAWLEPAMLLVPAALLAVLAPVPGMPALAFASTSAALVAAALWISARRIAREGEREHPRIRVRLPAAALVEQRDDERRTGSLLERALKGVRRRCELALAIPVPELVLEPAGGLRDDELELRFGERVLGRGHRFVADPDPTPGSPGVHDSWVLSVFLLLMRGAESLVELEQIEAKIEAVRHRQPSLVRQAMREVETVDLLAIVRAFVRERIPAPSMEALVRALAEGRVFRDPAERRHWPEHARLALADHWVQDLCDAVSELGELRFVRPTAELEDAVLARAELGDGGKVALHMPADERARVLELASGLRARGPIVVVCSSDARPAFARLLEGVRPYVPVVGVAELAAAGIEPEPLEWLS